MDISKIKAQNEDGSYNVIIEISMNDNPVKYEFDKDLGAIIVDRIMQVPMFYPANYGFIPHTLSGDGDPADVLVLTQHPIIVGAVIATRPIGVLMMEDESGIDEKILAVPAQHIDLMYKDVADISDINDILLQRINHFFEHYKKLEKNKWVKISDWQNAKIALQIIDKSIAKA